MDVAGVNKVEPAHGAAEVPLFASDLACSVMTVLRNRLIDALRPLIPRNSQPLLTVHLLGKSQLLRSLVWYQEGLEQVSAIARAARATVADLCLDMMPDRFFPNLNPPQHQVIHSWLTFDQITTALGVIREHEVVAVRSSDKSEVLLIWVQKAFLQHLYFDKLTLYLSVECIE